LSSNDCHDFNDTLIHFVENTIHTTKTRSVSWFNKFTLPTDFEGYINTSWLTLYVNIGRKQKIRKMDIVGFLTNDLKIPFEKIGLIHVADNYSYLALDKKHYFANKNLFQGGLKIKKTNAKINVCR
jgi:ATP-independent RNA helicase DbpA